MLNSFMVATKAALPRGAADKVKNGVDISAMESKERQW